MFYKILISGQIEAVTGLHIGTGGEYSAIGAADSPVIRDAVTGLPYIPGSSLKGKLRTLLAKKYDEVYPVPHNNDDEKIFNLFGGMTESGKPVPSKLIFSDNPIRNMDELKELGVYNPTEVKFENTISRMKSIANPRQIERVVRQSKFDMKIIYTTDKSEEIKEDISLLADGFNLLRYDYLGGHGSRGYGRVKISDLSCEAVIGNYDGEIDDVIEECNEILREVSADEI